MQRADITLVAVRKSVEETSSGFLKRDSVIYWLWVSAWALPFLQYLVFL